MNRPSRSAAPLNTRERMQRDFARSATLRQVYPQLAEVRVELEFKDGTARSPSAQSFSYFPGARGFFRYACPCHSCTGEFDLTQFIAEAAANEESTPRTRRIDVSCTGQRAHDASQRLACPIGVRVRVSVKLRAAE